MEATVYNQWAYSNSSCLEEVRHSPLQVFLYFFAAAMVLLTVCGNLLVIISISHFKQLHTPTNVIVLSLAVSDLLVGVTVMPFVLSTYIETRWCFGAIFCEIHKVFMCLLAYGSVYTVTYISVDRYFAICKPFFYMTKMTVNVSLLVLSHLWLCSVVFSLTMLYCNGNLGNVLNVFILECTVTMSEEWGFFDLLYAFFLPCSVMMILYMKIFFVARSHARSIRVSRSVCSKGNLNLKSSMASERKAAKTLGVFVLAYVLCIIPLYIISLIGPKVLTPGLYNPLIKLAYGIWLFNSVINPVMYAFFYPWFHRCVKLIVTFKLCSFESSLMNVLADHT